MGGTLPTGYTLAQLIDWTRGKDVQNATAPTGTRFVFADPLHSRPVAVTYGGTETNPDISVFVSTNSGFLHAINNDTGAEQFAFIPKELLPLQKTLFDNLASVPHPSGLDGSITVWVKDPEADGVVLNSSNTLQTGNGVYLYVGMRRGGRNYYALDVSDRANPKIMWTIKGGTTTGFNNLGQTWSQPLKTQIKLNGTVTDVLIFAGGYASNNNQDNSTQRDSFASDTDGNAIYVVNAMTGALIWSATGATAGFTDMKYSIPSNITGADINGDGLMDVMFVGDMGGQLWRFDIDNTATTAANLVKGGVIADLNAGTDAPTPANNRRFFQAPALFLGATSANKPYLGVAIGSGYRAHPLNNATSDNFYMIKQYDVFTAPTSYTKLTDDDLYDATDNLIGEGTSTQKTAALVDLDAKAGWYLTLDNQGEKVLSMPLVVEGQLFFDTYQPGTPPDNDPCTPATGITRSYTVSAFDATPVNDINGMVGLQASDRSQIIKSAGIIDTQRQIVKVVNNELRNFGIEGQNIKNLPSDLLKQVHRIYWYENR
jgi:type IV pilus assembly protein PilY1